MNYSSGDATDLHWERGVKIIPASDSSLLVVFGDTMAPEMQARVLGLFYVLQAQRDKRIRNLHPAYVSLLVDFDPLAMSQEEAVAWVESAGGDGAASAVNSSRAVEIPVCYDQECGPDLSDVATHAGLAVGDVVRLHSGATYDVCFLGFTGGFAYLGGMPAELSTPRLATPRRTVAAGSVGIAGSQTGIYPAETPGGWRLIGRTPLRMFDPQAGPPTLLMPGDRVRFTPIDHGEFERLWQERR